jgi:DNA-binding transcriptional LysR family regulator
VKSIPYKDITLSQLRSFCATARQGSLSAAAAMLGLAQPTVWKQVHALERTFGSKLVEPYARGCRLTKAGEVLRQLLEPAVANLDPERLQARFTEELGQTDVHITIAGQPRLLAEDLPSSLAAFVSSWPRARFTLRQANADEVAALVESGEASLGFTILSEKHKYPHLSFDLWYELDVILLTPPDHPLARQQRVRPEDLKSYPLINATTALCNTQAHDKLVRLGLYQTEPRWVEARHVAIIRSCVERGLGIALVPGVWPRETPSRLHERAMSRYFGSIPVYLVRRRGVHQHAAIDAFAEEVRIHLAHRKKRARR